MSENEELQVLRNQIDALDKQIHQLVNDRARCAQDVAVVKEKYRADDAPIVYYRPEREAQVLRKVMDRNQGPLPDETMARLFREIMSSCLALENPMQIAFLGPEGTFTQAAAIKHFGHGVECQSQDSIDDVFREVEAGSANYGVVPVENSTGGMVTHTLDNFVGSNLQICGEVALRIHHHLLVKNKDQAFTKIYSHSQSLAQCRQWLDANFPNVERIPVSSNAEAARRAADEEGAAAVAGEVAAERYGLLLQAEKIEDRPDNSTRFLIVGREKADISGEDKTSILVSSRDKPGALYQLLQPFHKADISLTRIETRPSRSTAWNYVFFIDFEGHQNDPIIQSVLTEMAEWASDVKVLGSYPKAVL